MTATVTDHMNKVRFTAKDLLFPFCIVLFAGFIRIPSVTQPLGPDQGIMAVIGEGLLRGGLPYRDYWEMASPAIFFTYALIFKIFGLSMYAIPIADTLVSMLTTLLIFLLARSIWDHKVGYISAILFAFFSNGVRLGMHAAGDIAFGTFWYIAQRETFMLPLIVASFYLILRPEGSETNPWRLTLSGVLAGLTFVFKFPSILFFLCIILFVNRDFFTKRPLSFSSRYIFRIAFLILGFILALLPFIFFLSQKGIIYEAVDVMFKYVYSVYGQIEHDTLATLKRGITYTLFIAKENFVLWIFFLTSSIYILLNDRTKHNLFLFFWALAALAYLISHREFFGYHYLVILPPFSIMTAYGIVKALGPNFTFNGIFSRDLRKLFILFILCSNVVFFLTSNYMHYTKFFYLVTKRISKKEYYDFFTAHPKHDYSFPADYEVSNYILDNSHPNEKIFVLGGTDSIIYFLTKRESPSRFIFSWIILSPYPHSKVKRAELYRQELLTDLKRKIPKYIVSIGALETFCKFSDIYQFIKSNYVKKKEFKHERFIYIYKAYNTLS